MVANIEGREFRRCYLASRNLPPEHPRACTTDDVECFFSVMRDTVGRDFSLKQYSMLGSAVAWNLQNELTQSYLSTTTRQPMEDSLRLLDRQLMSRLVGLLVLVVFGGVKC